MERYDAVIIGSGLGGLQCAYILAGQGMKVCVLEKNGRTGGCLQNFKRGEIKFDTGFHYVGGLDDGQPLNRLFRYFGLMDLPWMRLDDEAFDEVVLNGASYCYCNGFDRFAERFSSLFPAQREGIRKYVDMLRDVGGNIFDVFSKGANLSASLFAQSAYGYMNSIIDDPTLRNVLSGASLKIELNPATLPLYSFAQINSSFIQSAWRLRGGGGQIVNSLIDSLTMMGCEVRTRAEVTRLIERNGRIAEAEINGGEERVEADYFIADTHPAVALALITESAVIHNIFRKRICSLENTFGMFTASLVLRADAVPYLNRNIYIYRNDRVWGYSEYRPENINTCAMVSFQAPADNSRFTRNIDLITPMYPQEVAQWNDAPQGARGEDYRLYKSRKAEALIRLISEYVPGLSADVVERVYSSTLLTYSHYIGSPGGSAFGVRKNFESPMTTILSPRTPEPNLFFTGQSINLHGMLGVSVTSFLTCKEILGAELYRNLF